MRQELHLKIEDKLLSFLERILTKFQEFEPPIQRFGSYVECDLILKMLFFTGVWTKKLEKSSQQ